VPAQISPLAGARCGCGSNAVLLRTEETAAGAARKRANRKSSRKNIAPRQKKPGMSRAFQLPLKRLIRAFGAPDRFLLSRGA